MILCQRRMKIPISPVEKSPPQSSQPVPRTAFPLCPLSLILGSAAMVQAGTLLQVTPQLLVSPGLTTTVL